MTAITDTSAAVIGGGIGGLAVALALLRRGAQVTVFEQAEALTEVGAGIQITPNGARVLEALGLADAAEAAGLRATAVEPVDAGSGRAIARFDLTGQAPPYRFFHRADLIGLLKDACAAAGAEVVLGTRAVADTDGRVETPGGRRQFDLVIGADGINSAARGVLNGAEAPFFTGQVAWRALVAMEAAPEARIWMAPGRHVVTYPLRGGRLNVVAVQERRAWAAEGWHHADDPANLRAAFAGLCPELTGILAQVEAPHLWGLFRHDVAKGWQSGRLALIGDAAHPTLPFLAQGANLALEDAWVLASCAGGDLARYEALRKPRVARAIAAANANARNYHLSGLRRVAAQTALRALGTVAPGAFLNRLDWLYGYHATQV